MAEHPNVALLRRGYEAYQKGDMDTINELLADDVVFHMSGRGPLAGDYKGKQEVFAFFGKIMELSDGTSQLDVHDVLANDEHGVVMVKGSATRNGRTRESNSVHVIHIKDGKLVELWDANPDLYGDDEFWSA